MICLFQGVDSGLVDSVNALRSSYSSLLATETEAGHMSKGHMLSMAFDGLFNHVYTEYCSAVRSVSGVDTPKSWRKIDVIREAGALQVKISPICHLRALKQIIFWVTHFCAVNGTLIKDYPYQDISHSWTTLNQGKIRQA